MHYRPRRPRHPNLPGRNFVFKNGGLSYRPRRPSKFGKHIHARARKVQKHKVGFFIFRDIKSNRTTRTIGQASENIK